MAVNPYWNSANADNGVLDGELIPDGPALWRFLIGNIATTFASEHHTFPTDSNVGAWHLPGSAVCLTGTTRPTERLDTSAFDENDNGRLFFDTDTDSLEVLTAFGGPTWVSLPSLTSANTWAALQTFSVGFTSTVAPTWTAGVVAKDIYVTAVDQAETGLVNLIRADSNDKAALPDGAVLEAATESGDGDRTIADKAYADTKETPIVTQATADMFASRDVNDTDSNPLAITSVYKAECSGFLVVLGAGDSRASVKSDTNATPVLVVGYFQALGSSHENGHCSVPILKDQYVTVTRAAGSATIVIHWIPFGTGGLVKQ